MKAKTTRSLALSPACQHLHEPTCLSKTLCQCHVLNTAATSLWSSPPLHRLLTLQLKMAKRNPKLHHLEDFYSLYSNIDGKVIVILKSTHMSNMSITAYRFLHNKGKQSLLLLSPHKQMLKEDKTKEQNIWKSLEAGP